MEQLIENHIEFIDVSGNIYLNNSGIYILVRNQPPKTKSNKSLEITSADLQIIYIILKAPNQLINLNEIAIADLSGVTPKTVKNTIKKLETLDYIQPIRPGFKIVNYLKLLERWELGYTEILRPKLLINTFNLAGKRNFSDIELELIELAKVYDYLIGGELAASIITQYLRPIGATLHLRHNNYRQIAVKLKLKPEPEGNIILLNNFGDYDHHLFNFRDHQINLINPLLTHAELVQSSNSRLNETAQIIYQKYIDTQIIDND